jgi:16S rRNA (cytidine1402-2'-O)-methyltransferase
MGILYIIASPIGNLEDITLRALRILKEVDAVFCEDTRVTGRMLAHFGISKPLFSLRERAQDKAIRHACDLLKEGKDIAYLTDAGTPGISDPGGKLVANAASLLGTATNIVPLPGASAMAAAASIAGISMDRFTFMGFPPHKKGRKTYFEHIASSEYPIIFYESPHRIIRTLKELENAYAQHKAICNLIVCRELTKKFETIYRGAPAEVIPEIEKNTRGEFVVISYN